MAHIVVPKSLVVLVLGIVLCWSFILMWVMPAQEEFDPQVKKLMSVNWEGNYAQAEVFMDGQWKQIIWPLIEKENFDTILEIAPGAGRSTSKLLGVTNHLIVVDISSKSLDLCRTRFSNSTANIQYLLTHNGKSIPSEIEPNSVSFVYSWESFIHFHSSVVRSYLKDIARVLKPGGTGFIHHSNLKNTDMPVDPEDFQKNTHWRAAFSMEEMAELCKEFGLKIKLQKALDWYPVPGVDGVTLFQK